MQQHQPYLNPHQTRSREPDTYENLLGDALERCFAAGLHDLDGICARLNQDCVPSPAAQTWTPALLQQELKRLSA
ncbi:MAG: recombinase-like helix-turn-helix domain-containing protein [Ferrovibrio sp.]|jgi:hypothetical protein|nr:hypothetical protein [Alphaproteobacteria bacterium]